MTSLPQYKDFSLQKAKLRKGQDHILCNLFVVSLFCIISPPMWATLCKLLVETLKVLFGDINITVRVCTLLFQVVRVYVALLSPWVGFLMFLKDKHIQLPFSNTIIVRSNIPL